jgi:hypothetical protein
MTFFVFLNNPASAEALMFFQQKLTSSMLVTWFGGGQFSPGSCV